MDIISFVSHEDLAEYMLSKAIEGKTVYAVLFYDDAKQLLKELSFFEETEYGSIELEIPNSNQYKKEYYIVLDDEFKIFVQKAFHDDNEWHEAGYYNFGDSDIVALIDSYANSQVIKAAGNSYCMEIEIDADADHDPCFDCDDCGVDLPDIIEYMLKTFLEE